MSSTNASLTLLYPIFCASCTKARSVSYTSRNLRSSIDGAANKPSLRAVSISSLSNSGFLLPGPDQDTSKRFIPCPVAHFMCFSATLGSLEEYSPRMGDRLWPCFHMSLSPGSNPQDIIESTYRKSSLLLLSLAQLFP